MVEVTARRKLLQRMQKQHFQVNHFREEKRGLRLTRTLEESLSSTPGVEIDVEVNALFQNYPAPTTETINAHIRETVDDPQAGANFVGNLSQAILDAGAFCDSPLALITNAEFEYVKNITLTNLNTGETSVVESETGSTGLNSSLILSPQDIIDYETYIDSCGSNETFPNITEPVFVAPPEPGFDEVSFSITIQEPTYAYFCNDENLEVPSPIVSQGDTLQVCVIMPDSDYFHVEDTFTFVLAQQNTTAEPFIPLLENEIKAPQIFVYDCELGICNHMMQVPSRFFEDPQPLQISGVSVLNLGEPDRRALRELQDQISERQKNSPSYFQLQALLNTNAGTVDNQSRSGAAGEALWIIIGAGIAVIIVSALVAIVIVRRRRPEDKKSSGATVASKTRSDSITVSSSGMFKSSQIRACSDEEVDDDPFS